MTPDRLKKSIHKHYDVTTKGTIASPGKFTGQHYSLPYFHGIALQGEAQHYLNGVALINVTEHEVKVFGLEETTWVAIHEDSKGRVSARFLR